VAGVESDEEESELSDVAISWPIRNTLKMKIPIMTITSTKPAKIMKLRGAREGGFMPEPLLCWKFP